MLKAVLPNYKFRNLKTKLIIYKYILKPWFSTIYCTLYYKTSNTNKIQTIQNISPRNITNAPCFVSNYTLCNELDIYKRNCQNIFK